MLQRAKRSDDRKVYYIAKEIYESMKNGTLDEQTYHTF